VGGAKASKGTDKLSFCVKSINQSNPLPNVRAHKIEQEIQKTMISFVPKILVGRPLDGLEGIKVHLSLSDLKRGQRVSKHQTCSSNSLYVLATADAY